MTASQRAAQRRRDRADGGGEYEAAMHAQSAVAYAQIMGDRVREGRPQVDEYGGPSWPAEMLAENLPTEPHVIAAIARANGQTTPLERPDR